MNNWINQNIGKEVLSPNPPHGIVGQCVYEASSWSMYQGGPELFPGATAYDIWLNFNHPFYERVTANYQPGDILFFKPNDPNVGTGEAGHVDVYVGGNETADDDWNGSHDLQLINNGNERFAVGAFRPKGGTMATDSLTREEIAGIYQLAFDNDDYPQDIINAYTGKPLDGLITQLLADPSYRQHRQQANNPSGATQLAPGLYKV